MSDLRTDLARGPWHAVAAFPDGYIVTDPDDLPDARTIAVVRGNAIPVAHTEGDDPQVPSGGYQLGDILYRLDYVDDDPDEARILWEQARAVAAALNTHRPDWPAAANPATVRIEARGDRPGIAALTELLFTIDPGTRILADRRRPDGHALLRADVDMPTDVYAAVGALLAPMPKDAYGLITTATTATTADPIDLDAMRTVFARLLGEPA